VDFGSPADDGMDMKPVHIDPLLNASCSHLWHSGGAMLVVPTEVHTALEATGARRVDTVWYGGQRCSSLSSAVI
jgi:hypothetical protein